MVSSPWKHTVMVAEPGTLVPHHTEDSVAHSKQRGIPVLPFHTDHDVVYFLYLF